MRKSVSESAVAPSASPGKKPAPARAAEPAAARAPTRVPRTKKARHADGIDTDTVVKKLREQGLVKPAPAAKASGAGHRTKDRRPVQINITETMYKELKIVSATHGVSVTDQIIAALEAQGYHS
jgi:carbamoylphosphate synthase small subunit